MGHFRRERLHLDVTVADKQHASKTVYTVLSLIKISTMNSVGYHQVGYWWDDAVDN